MRKFVEYLNEHYNSGKNRNRVEYYFKAVPQSLATFHENKSKERKVLWTPESFDIISHDAGLTDEAILNIRKAVLDVKNGMRENVEFFEDIPGSYLDFVKEFYGLNLFRGSITLSTALIENTTCLKPTCLKGQFFIGQYAGITPVSCPIFTNTKGEIFVYGAENFRNYPQTDSPKELKRYLKQKVTQVGYWASIDEFLISECERLKETFISAPSLYALKDCAPRNR